MKPSIDYMGKHTTISYLTEKEWSQIPYLKENDGALPPFVIAVGDSRRAEKACKILNLKCVVHLHREGERLLGISGRGRIDLIIGQFTHKDKSIPILLVETQMGMPATEINLREVVAHCSPDYHFSHNRIQTDGIDLIRVGTAGGINGRTGESLVVGDIVNGTFSIGWAGTLIESLADLDYGSGKTIENFRGEWKDRGGHFTPDNKYPAAESSHRIIEAINSAATEIGVRSLKGGNFSKDSLYAEIDEEAFTELRDKYGVMSTEMEQMAIAKLSTDFAQIGIELHAGLVSGIIGLIPGGSFAEEKDHDKIKRVEEDSLKVAATALWNLAQ